MEKEKTRVFSATDVIQQQVLAWEWPNQVEIVLSQPLLVPEECAKAVKHD